MSSWRTHLSNRPLGSLSENSYLLPLYGERWECSR
jgi:hypothetical protein